MNSAKQILQPFKYLMTRGCQKWEVAYSLFNLEEKTRWSLVCYYLIPLSILHSERCLCSSSVVSVLVQTCQRLMLAQGLTDPCHSCCCLLRWPPGVIGCFQSMLLGGSLTQRGPGSPVPPCVCVCVLFSFLLFLWDFVHRHSSSVAPSATRGLL